MVFGLARLFQSLTKPNLHLSKPLFARSIHLQTTDPCCSYIRLLQCHTKLRSILRVHARIIIEGSSQSSFFATHLVKSYAKVGNFSAARQVFESVSEKSTFLYNAIIRACSCKEEWSEIAELFSRMEGEGMEPDHYTLPFVIKSFAILHAVEEGKNVHNFAILTGLVFNPHVATALIDMYVEFGELSFACKIFNEMLTRDVVAWTMMISGYVKCGELQEALLVFRDMRLRGVKPNWVTVLSLIPACDYSIHAFVIRSGFDVYTEVETGILNLYAKIGDVRTAHILFIQMSEKTLVSWAAMVGGYSQNGYAREALIMFSQMLKTTDLKPDSIIAASVLQACAQLGSLSCGEMNHGYLIQAGANAELLVESGLINMYSKCGSIKAAERIFNATLNQNMITWSAMIAGYGHHGHGRKALDMFEQMKQDGFVPDEMAFLSVLSACSHSGLVSEGKTCFESMVIRYNIVPKAKHYACMVDLLGRAGLVDEAWSLTKEMQVKPDANVWIALLSACRVKGDVRVGEFACKSLLELEPDNTDNYVLLANIYAGCEKWDEMSKIRSMLRNRGERKAPGCSHIEVNGKTHTFFAGHLSHPDLHHIHSMLDMVHFFLSEAIEIKLQMQNL